MSLNQALLNVVTECVRYQVLEDSLGYIAAELCLQFVLAI